MIKKVFVVLTEKCFDCLKCVNKFRANTNFKLNMASGDEILLSELCLIH